MKKIIKLSEVILSVDDVTQKEVHLKKLNHSMVTKMYRDFFEANKGKQIGIMINEIKVEIELDMEKIIKKELREMGYRL